MMRKNAVTPQKQLGSRAIRRMVLTSLLFAVSLVLSLVESAVPIPMPVPGIRLGLSNIVVMYTLFFLGRRQAFLLAAMKALFVFLTRGFVACVLSFTGGMLSVLVMLLLMWMLGERISYLMLSMAGAITHNVGQLAAVSFIYTSLFTWGYLPVVLASGVLAGIATSTLLKCSLPAFKRLGLQ